VQPSSLVPFDDNIHGSAPVEATIAVLWCSGDGVRRSVAAWQANRKCCSWASCCRIMSVVTQATRAYLPTTLQYPATHSRQSIVNHHHLELPLRRLTIRLILCSRRRVRNPSLRVPIEQALTLRPMRVPDGIRHGYPAIADDACPEENGRRVTRVYEPVSCHLVDVIAVGDMGGADDG
jgi:hypothetical protein